MSSDASAPSVRDQVSPEEWKLRVELAAVFRLVALEGWAELAIAHASARIPGKNEFLFLPADLAFDEITASSLQKIDADGRLLMPSSLPQHKFAYALHVPTYKRFAKANCILHMHTSAGTAVSMQKHGLLPSSQYALWLGPISYVDYHGHTANMEEGERLAEAFGNSQFLMMRSHGTMNWGETVGQTFVLAFFFTRACEKQIMALAGQTELYCPTADVIARTPIQARSVTAPDGAFGLINWATALRKADRLSPGYDR